MDTCAHLLVRDRARPRCPGPHSVTCLQHVTSRMQLSVQKEIIPMVTTAYLRIRKEFPSLGGDIVKPDTEEEEALDRFEFTCHLSHLTT